MGKIKLLRLDSRLAHGKIVELWCDSYQLENLIIANDRLAGDDFAQEVMSLTIPKNIRATYLPIKSLGDFLRENPYEYMVLVEESLDIKGILDQQIEIENVNIGIIHMEMGKKSITKQVAVDDGDMQIFKEVLEKNIKATVQLTPLTEEKDLKDFF